MTFMVRLYQKQVDQGRVFLHEQPAHAKSWMIPEIRKIMTKSGVTLVEATQCMCGLRARGPNSNLEMHAKKPTKCMTNSQALGQELSKKCDGKHTHRCLVDGRAHGAAKYPPGLCRAICRGIIKLKKEKEEEAVRVIATILKDCKKKMPDPEEVHEKEEAEIKNAQPQQAYIPE